MIMMNLLDDGGGIENANDSNYVDGWKQSQASHCPGVRNVGSE